MSIVCAVCGRPEDEHHQFEALMPDGCQCSSGEWGETVTPICSEYVGNGTTYCATCEHDKACHK